MVKIILQLAAELQCLIMQQLDDNMDIRNTRLANSHLAAACDEIFVNRFIKSRSHYYTKDSLELLTEISRSRYAENIQNIKFVPLYSAHISYHYDYALQRPGMREWVAADNAFRSSQHDLPLLVQILNNVGAASANLSITLASYPSQTTYGAKMLVDAYAAIDKAPQDLDEIMALLGKEEFTFETPIIDVVNRASAHADFPLAGLDMRKCYSLVSKLPILSSLPACPWRNIKALKLSKIAKETAEYLRDAPALEELHVLYDQFTLFEEPWEPATKLLAESTTSLNALHLSGYYGPLDVLLQLLYKHQNILRTLTLQDIRLPTPQDWTLLLDALATSFALTKQFFLIYPNLARGGDDLIPWVVRGPFRHFYVGEQKFKYCVKKGEKEISSHLRKLLAEGVFVEEESDESDRALWSKPCDEFQYLSEAYGEWEDELWNPSRCDRSL